MPKSMRLKYEPSSDVPFSLITYRQMLTFETFDVPTSHARGAETGSEIHWWVGTCPLDR